MRITGGEYCGRRLEPLKDKTIRPTTDKVRQAIFNMLDSRDLISRRIVLDAFCGTGSLGLEALSRNATYCIFCDISKRSLELSKQNASRLGLPGKSDFLLMDSTKPKAAQKQANLVFLDPPYRQGLVSQTLRALKDKDWFGHDAVIVVETEKNAAFLFPEPFTVFHEKTYGDTSVLLLKTGT